ncbi:MAG: hypothetical protein LC750_00525 [Actinobacteria bacterium]|nr:hypothetical protein [Actinomycetota bacterium]
MARRRKILQTNFSAGEIAPELGMRQDADQYANGAKSLHNMRCLIGGGVTRRPGTWWTDELAADSVVIAFIADSSAKYYLVFSHQRMDAYLTDGTPAGSLTGAPWETPRWSEMDYVQSGNTVFLAHPEMPTQVVTRTGAATWSRADFAFFGGAGGRVEQPYYRVQAATITLQPSALTGSVTLQFSAPYFTVAAFSDYVGTRIRYLGREIQITAVTDGDTATGTVIEDLPPTQRLTVGTYVGFAVGHVVTGDTSGAQGVITAIPDGTHIDVVITSRLIKFEAEDLIGPDQVVAVSAVADISAAAVTDWDEQLIGPVYGYPSCVALHRNRLLFAGHPMVPNGLMASRLGNLYSFDVGDGTDADGIFETIGDGGASAIVQLFSAEQLLIGTDKGLYYVPEGQANPFRPTSIAFFPFASPWPITATAKACAFDNGVLWVSGSLVIIARPTGNLTQSWDAEEVSLLSPHLIDNPTRMAVVSNFNDGPERYALLVNTDGTIVPLQLVQAQRIRNASPWEFDGVVLAVASIDGQIVMTSRRTVTTARNFLEIFDQNLTLDLAQEFDDLDDLVADYGSATVNVVVGDYSLGTYPLAIENPPAGPYTVGFYYDTRTEILPPALEDDEGPIAGDMSRIVESHVTVLSSARFAQNGLELAAYQMADDVSAAPPRKDGAQRFQHMGWSVDPTIYITQPDPLPLTVLAVRTTVAFRS